MQPAKVDVMIARFPYAGNGGTQAETPDVSDWMTDTIIEMSNDPRIGTICRWRESDTPITMTRNAAAYAAQAKKVDLLLMIDSDMAPDRELKMGDKDAKPFWRTSFDFAYERRMQGKVTVIAAPYCGPPPLEIPYIFRWCNYQTDHPNTDLRVEMYSREEAATRGGIEAVAALPTGLCLFDVAALELVMPEPFYYEYENDGPMCDLCGQRAPGPRSQKCSTEDVTATRDISFASIEKWGESSLFVNWDAWAGHWKPKCVGKPRLITAEMIGEKYKKAVLSGRRNDHKLVMVADGRPGMLGQDRLKDMFEQQRQNASANGIPGVPEPAGC